MARNPLALPGMVATSYVGERLMSPGFQSYLAMQGPQAPIGGRNWLPLVADRVMGEMPVPVEMGDEEPPDQRSMLSNETPVEVELPEEQYARLEQPGGVEAPEIINEPDDYGDDPRAAYAAQQQMAERRRLAAIPPRRLAGNLSGTLAQAVRGGGRMVG